MDATYLDIRSAHGRVWPVERKRETVRCVIPKSGRSVNVMDATYLDIRSEKRETGMAASSTICSVEISRTSESQFARMQILARHRERKNAR